ncbi:fused MFS/spermidine synthase [Acidobacteriota bacterium]
MRRLTLKEILVFALFFFSGITGLVYEVAWTRMFVTVFGSTTHAVSTVLAAFMAGLALGSLVLGKKGDRFSRPILIYGVLEILIGLYALAVPWIIKGLSGFYATVFATFEHQTLPVVILRFFLSFAVILIPTTLMGGTLPVLSKFAGRELPKVGRKIGALYALNTFGAVIGTFAAGFYLLERVGVSASVLYAAMLSIFVGIAAIFAGRKAVAKGADEAVATPQDSDALPRYVSVVTLSAIAISGGAALACEVIYTKVLIFSLGTTAHAFSLMLMTFLIGIALGSFVASRYVDRHSRPTELFGIIEILLGLTVFLSIFLLARLDLMHRFLAIKDAGGNLFRLRGAGFLQAALIMLVPSLFMGAAFPVVIRIYAKGNRVALSVGRIYFFNTIGAVAGSLLAGFVLVPLLGSARAIAFAATFTVAVGVLLFSCTRKKRLWISAAAVTFAALMIVTALIRPAIFARTFNIKEAGSELLYFKEGTTGTVTVHRYQDFDRLAIDGVNVAGTSDMLRITQKLQGHLPILLADGNERVAHIGFGSGETLRILTLHDIGTIDGIEICKDVIQVSKRYFTELNRHVFNRDDINIVIMDGKNFVLLTDNQYDVIMTDSIYPGGSHASALYTYDHFKAVREKLKPGGIASCWLPIDLSNQDLKVAVKAFYDNFPDMAIWYFHMTYNQHALLVGKKDAKLTIDVAKFERAFRKAEIREDFKAIFIDDLPTLFSCFITDRNAAMRFCQNAPRHSDDHPILEFGIARRGTGTSRPYLSSNIEELLALRPNPVPFLTNLEASSFDPETLKQEALKQTGLSSVIISGHVHHALGEIGSARAMYASVLDHDPGNRIATNLVQQIDQTVDRLEALARLGKGDYSTLFRLGVIYLSEGKYEKAASYLEQVRSLRPDLPNAHKSLGECYLRWGKPDRAIEYLLKAQSMTPHDAGVFQRLGRAYEGLGKTGEARHAFQEALRLNPGSYEARVHLGQFDLAESKYEKAREHFFAATQIAPARPHALYNLGLIHAKEGEWHKALSYYKKTLSYTPSFYPARFEAGNALYELGAREAAIKEWRTTLAIKPDHEGAKERLGALGSAQQ